MIKKVKIYGFRSIKSLEIELAPINIIYGSTSSGKSSLLYALLVIRNFILNPTTTIDGLFNLKFMDLGSFKECVFNKDTEKPIYISYSTENGEYGISIREEDFDIFSESYVDLFLNSDIKDIVSLEGKDIISLEGKVSIPYRLNQNFAFVIKENNIEYIINWNGITVNVSPKQLTKETRQIALKITKKLNSIPDYVRKIDIVPHIRGFFKPFYSPSQVGDIPISDDELATLIISNSDLQSKISLDLEKILNKEFRTYNPPGIATVSLLTVDKNSRVANNIVNDGFGVNQIVYMLAKIHREGIKTILIEEPEVHLHPSAIRSLVKVLCSIVKNDEKQIIITTHSEVFVLSLLAQIKSKKISPKEVKFFLAKKDKKETEFLEQKVNEEGQVEGGLLSFVEGELEDFKVFFEKT